MNVLGSYVWGVFFFFKVLCFFINLSFTLLHNTSDDLFFFNFFQCFHMIFNNSSLFMSMSNLI
jgi:hypothetical protein